MGEVIKKKQVEEIHYGGIVYYHVNGELQYLVKDGELRDDCEFEWEEAYAYYLEEKRLDHLYPER